MSKRLYLLLAVAVVALFSAYNITATDMIDDTNAADQDYEEQIYEREKCVENCA